MRAVLRPAFLLWVALASFAALAFAGAEASAAADGKIDTTTFDADLLAGLLVKEANRVRKEHHARALRVRPEVKEAAEEQASRMAAILRPTHDNPLEGARTVAERLRRAGLKEGQGAENVQMFMLEHQTYAELAVALIRVWAEDPGDRQNLLNGGLDFAGYAARPGRLATGETAVFVVAVFYRAERSADPAASTTVAPSAITRSRRGAM